MRVSGLSAEAGKPPLPPLSPVDTELDALLREGIRLERAGKMDAATRARFDAQFEALSKKQDDEFKAEFARIEAGHAAVVGKPARRPGPWGWTVIGVFFAALAGCLLELLAGDRFIFAGANAYRAAMPWAWGAVALPIGVLMFVQQRKQHAVLRAGDTRADGAVKFVAMVATAAGLAVVGPLGWISVLGRALGEPASPVVLRVNWVEDEPMSRRKGCQRSADVTLRDVTARICIDGLVSGEVPRAGQRVLATGRRSALGFYIESIAAQ